MVPVDKALDHVRKLGEAGYSYGLIAHLSGVDETTVERIGGGRYTQVMVDTEERIIRVPAASLWTLWHTVDLPHRMPSGPVVRRLRALVADGWTYTEIGDAVGWTRSLVWRYVSRPPERTTSTTARHIDEVYRSTMFAVPARRARPEVIAKRWPRPLDWDDIDDLGRSTRDAYRRSERRARGEEERVLDLC